MKPEAAKENKEHQLVPLLWTSGGAGGYVTRDAYERITCELVGTLSRVACRRRLSGYARRNGMRGL